MHLKSSPERLHTKKAPYVKVIEKFSANEASKIDKVK